MLKPKYVHGLNAEEAPKSLLSRLHRDGALSDHDSNPPGMPDDLGDNSGPPVWAWILG
jgi:hypothetical protein